MNIESKLASVLYQVDRTKHIKVKAEICQACEERWCLNICPSECFTLIEDRVEFAYEGCLECGACEKVCEEKSNRGLISLAICYSPRSTKSTISLTRNFVP